VRKGYEGLAVSLVMLLIVWFFVAIVKLLF